MNTQTDDKRPARKIRKHPQLWQSYLFWYELREMRKKHLLRISSAEREASSFNILFEQQMIEALRLDAHVDPKNKKDIASVNGDPVKLIMIEYGQAVGPIWDWCLSHKGIADSLAAQLLAQIDDIANFATIAKLWRYCGYGTFEYWVNDKGEIMAPVAGNRWVNKEKILTIVRPKSEWNGQTEAMYREPEPGWKLVRHRDINIEGYHSPYNRLLKAILFNVADQFVRQQSLPWVDIFYDEKERQRQIHPVAICLTCKVECDHERKIVKGKMANVFTCPNKKSHGKRKYTDDHIRNMARRKMIKAFLAELWLEWRRLEGLPVTEAFED